MPGFVIREPIESDIRALRPVFHEWIRDRRTGAFVFREAELVNSSLRASIKGRGSQQYLIAEQSGRAIGIMGIQPPGETMRQFAETSNPAELITALIENENRGRGIGRALVEALTTKAENQDTAELIVNSSLRYQETGWPFWSKLFGDPVDVAKDYFGRGNHTVVWRQPLETVE